MASLENRGDSIRLAWRLGGTRDGARQSCTFSGGTETARSKTAETARALVEARGHNMTRDEVYDAILGTGPPPATTVPTFKQWSLQWLAERRQRRDVTKGTLSKYEIALRVRGVPFLGHLRLTDIDRDIIKAFVAWMSGSRVTRGSRKRRGGKDASQLISALTVKQNFGIVSACLAAAVPRWLPSNPAARIPGDRRNSVGLPKVTRYDAMFLTRDEIDRILACCPPYLRDVVYTALLTGLRRGELMALEARHVVFGRSGGATILVRQSVRNDGSLGPPKSAGGLRDVTVPGDAAAVLRRCVRGKSPSAPVFVNRQGRRWALRTLNEAWARAVADARRCPDHLPPRAPEGRNGKIPYWADGDVSTCDCRGVLRRAPRLHDARHTHASVLIEKGWHAKKIQRRLGHSSYTITMEVYGHLMDTGDEQELNGVEGWFTAV